MQVKKNQTISALKTLKLTVMIKVICHWRSVRSTCSKSSDKCPLTSIKKIWAICNFRRQHTSLPQIATCWNSDSWSIETDPIKRPNQKLFHSNQIKGSNRLWNYNKVNNENRCIMDSTWTTWCSIRVPGLLAATWDRKEPCQLTSTHNHRKCSHQTSRVWAASPSYRITTMDTPSSKKCSQRMCAWTSMKLLRIL